MMELLNNKPVRIVVPFLVVLMRILFGLGWLLAGATKMTGKAGEISWFQYPGEFLAAYLNKALEKPNVPDFYKYFIEHFALDHVLFFNYIIPVIQVILGVLVILGIRIITCVIICLFMHINFILSGNMNLLSLTLYTSAFGILLNRPVLKTKLFKIPLLSYNNSL